MTHIYNINSGERRPQEGLKYPIRPSNTKGTRGLKFSEEEVIVIHEALLNTNKDYNVLATEFNCNRETISHINKGDRKAYHLP